MPFKEVRKSRVAIIREVEVKAFKRDSTRLISKVILITINYR